MLQLKKRKPGSQERPGENSLADNDHVSPRLVQGWDIPRLVCKVSPGPGHLCSQTTKVALGFGGSGAQDPVFFSRWLFIINCNAVAVSNLEKKYILTNATFHCIGDLQVSKSKVPVNRPHNK